MELEECNALLASEHEQFNISRVFCAYLESRRTLRYVQCLTEPSIYYYIERNSRIETIR